MNANLLRPGIGQWYAHSDKGKLFQVVGRDGESRNIEIQYVDGETWSMLPLVRVEPPEDVTVSVDDIETDAFGYSETDMTAADWEELLQPLRAQKEGWEDIEPEDERDPLGEGRPVEPFIAETAEAQECTR